jgi:hypothetical protein
MCINPREIFLFPMNSSRFIGKNDSPRNLWKYGLYWTKKCTQAGSIFFPFPLSAVTTKPDTQTHDCWRRPPTDAVPLAYLRAPPPLPVGDAHMALSTGTTHLSLHAGTTSFAYRRRPICPSVPPPHHLTTGTTSACRRRPLYMSVPPTSLCLSALPLCILVRPHLHR